MDTSARFFAKLRSLAVTLETERTNLEQAATRNQDEDEGISKKMSDKCCVLSV